MVRSDGRKRKISGEVMFEELSSEVSDALGIPRQVNELLFIALSESEPTWRK